MEMQPARIFLSVLGKRCYSGSTLLLGRGGLRHANYSECQTFPEGGEQRGHSYYSSQDRRSGQFSVITFPVWPEGGSAKGTIHFSQEESKHRQCRRCLWACSRLTSICTTPKQEQAELAVKAGTVNVGGVRRHRQCWRCSPAPGGYALPVSICGIGRGSPSIRWKRPGSRLRLTWRTKPARLVLD